MFGIAGRSVRFVFPIVLLVSMLGVAPRATAAEVTGAAINPTVTWHTFAGGADGGDERPSKAVFDDAGNLYVAGMSSAAGWGIDPVRPWTNWWDAFVAKFGPSGNLIWYTFMGSTGQDEARGVVLDSAGNIYVSGYSPGAWGCESDCTVRDHSGGYDAFVAKLDSSGNLVWNTFLGAGGEDSGGGIALDGLGNLYTGGYSDTTWGSPVHTIDTNGDGFLAKLDAATGGLTWNTFLGGSEADGVGPVLLTSGPQLLVAGVSAGAWGCSPTPCTTRQYTDGNDAMVAGFNPSTGALIWNSFFGGSASDSANSLARDSAGNLYIGGYSYASWGCEPDPACTRRPFSAGVDAFAAKLDSGGLPIWNTFLGGSSYQYSYDIDLDEAGNLYVVGLSGGAWGKPLIPFAGYEDAFAAKLGPSGALASHLFLGSSESDRGYALAIDSSGSVYVVGDSGSTWGTPLHPHSGYFDIFIAKTDFALVVRSKGASDGWILESGETTEAGGSMDSAASTLYVGADATDRQYRGMLSFDTAALPDKAVIQKYTLKVKKAGIVGANPFGSLGKLMVDAHKGAFSGNAALELGDFAEAATKVSALAIPNTPAQNWYAKTYIGNPAYINRKGITQFRLQFALDDDDDLLAEAIKFYSGSASSANRPLLLIVFTVP